ncbi:MAG: T9SS type A sorting domain-containing protein [Bacteroidales bacterium]|nr:T9SS type A sorting domain-containing protein [Bacteroidales bacterium]
MNFKTITSFLGLCLCSFIGINSTLSQVAPLAQPVYGGYIEEMDAIPIDATTSRVFISTMSPNALFYADMEDLTSTPIFSSFAVVPDMDASASLGFLRCFAVDENSEFIFAALGSGGIYGCDITASTLYTIESGMIEALEAHFGRLFYIKHFGTDEYLYFTDIAPSGLTGTIDSVLIASSPGWDNRFALDIIIHPVSTELYIFVPGGGSAAGPFIYKSSDTYNSISTTTVFSLISTSDLTTTGYEYNAMGIASDSRIYCGSYEGNSSGSQTRIAYTNVDGDPWTNDIIPLDAGRGKITISNSSSGNYNIYYSRIMSDDQAVSWQMHGGADGAIQTDPINEELCYVRTDWGIGVYDHTSTTVTEINDGVLAVQVNDFDMSDDKDTAWVASKSGIWRVTDYQTTPIWSDPIWPADQSVPWNRVTCTPSSDTMYCGNSSGNMLRWIRANGDPNDAMNYHEIFRAEDDAAFPYWNWTYSTNVSAIAIDPFATNESVFVGLYDMEDWDEPADSLGALFYGVNNSGIWNWTHIYGGDIPTSGIDINDIVVVQEASSTVAYVAVERNTSYTTVNGVYRVEDNGGSYTCTQDLFLSASYPIAATIVDIHVSNNDTIYCCGTDASGTTVVSYKKAISDTYWTVITPSGLTFPNTGRAITYDDTHHDLYMAVDETIYVLYNGTSSWTPLWSYPTGTQINVIYYDDLLVGTGTGLYMHPYSGVGIPDYKEVAFEVSLSPNPTKGIIHLTHDLSKKQILTIEIYDNSGKKVFESEYNSGPKETISISTSEMKAGIYYLSIQSKQGTVTKRLVIL